MNSTTLNTRIQNSNLSPNDFQEVTGTTFVGTIDYKVNTVTGEAFVSQRKAAELLGVSQSAISQRCLSQNFDVSQGVTSDFLSLLITHYALDARNPTAEAKALLKLTSAAGTKAYIYHHAGVKISAAPQPQFSLPQTYSEALRMLADETDAHETTKVQLTYKTEKLDEAVGHLRAALDVMTSTAPKAKAFDETLGKGNNMLISEAAKVLGVQQHDLFDWLAANKWIFRRGSKPWMAYADKTHSRLLVHRYAKVLDTEGREHTNCQVMVTPVGIVALKALLQQQ